MKPECSIVRDLLPLYAEEMVSDETARFVSEHLKLCAECREELASLKDGEVIERVHSDKCKTHNVYLLFIMGFVSLLYTTCFGLLLCI